MMFKEIAHDFNIDITDLNIDLTWCEHNFHMSVT